MTPNETNIKAHILDCILEIARLNNSNDKDRIKNIKYQLEIISSIMPTYRTNLTDKASSDYKVNFNANIFFMLEELFNNNLDSFEFYIQNLLTNIKERKLIENNQ